MFLLTWLTMALAYAASGHVLPRAGSYDDSTDWCRTAATPEWLAEQSSLGETGREMMSRQSSITVDTYFHVVANSTRVQDGYLTVRWPDPTQKIAP